MTEFLYILLLMILCLISVCSAVYAVVKLIDLECELGWFSKNDDKMPERIRQLNS